mmetsp:Transcript_3797/g.12666  ORF Transcript_3797/g.12666 Transcript_3797/m.12666 type:complete len:368 (+) Transcript_3797:159-1262(+)
MRPSVAARTPVHRKRARRATPGPIVQPEGWSHAHVSRGSDEAACIGTRTRLLRLRRHPIARLLASHVLLPHAADLAHAAHRLAHASHWLPHAGHRLPHAAHRMAHAAHRLPHAAHWVPHTTSHASHALSHPSHGLSSAHALSHPHHGLAVAAGRGVPRGHVGCSSHHATGAHHASTTHLLAGHPTEPRIARLLLPRRRRSSRGRGLGLGHGGHGRARALARGTRRGGGGRRADVVEVDQSGRRAQRLARPLLGAVGCGLEALLAHAGRYRPGLSGLVDRKRCQMGWRLRGSERIGHERWPGRRRRRRRGALSKWIRHSGRAPAGKRIRRRSRGCALREWVAHVAAPERIRSLPGARRRSAEIEAAEA